MTRFNLIVAAGAAGIALASVAPAAHAEQETSVTAGVTYNTGSGKVDWNAGASQSNTTSSSRGSSTTTVEVKTVNGKTFSGQATQTTTRK
jgi:hypothetical protein